MLRATPASRKIAQLLATIHDDHVRAEMRDHVEARIQVMREQFRNADEAIDEIAYRELWQLFTDAGRRVAA